MPVVTYVMNDWKFTKEQLDKLDNKIQQEPIKEKIAHKTVIKD